MVWRVADWISAGVSERVPEIARFTTKAREDGDASTRYPGPETEKISDNTLNSPKQSKHMQGHRNVMAGSRTWGKLREKQGSASSKKVTYKESPPAPPRGDV